MLDTHLRADTVLFAPSVRDWQQALDEVAAPLVAAGSIKPDYVEAMRASIAGGGTYIDLGFGIALAHSRPEAGVLTTGLSMLLVDQPFLLADDPDHPIRLMLCLAAVDSDEHLDTMRQLAAVLTDPSRRDALLNATTLADVEAITRQENQ